MRRVLFFIVLFSFTFQLNAQVNKMRRVLDDEMELMDNDNQTLRFFDSQTGDPIINATVKIVDIGEFTTDSEGKVRFPNQPDGYIKVDFEKEGYISCNFKIEIVADMIYFNRFSVSPKIDLGQMRVVLDWIDFPEDLDAHMVKKGSYHISFRDTKVLSDGTGELDRDDMDGYGPETITISDIDDNSNYEFYVHDYSHRMSKNSDKLYKSKACVKVYANNQLVDKINIPKGQRGVVWHVFSINNGNVNIINKID